MAGKSRKQSSPALSPVQSKPERPAPHFEPGGEVFPTARINIGKSQALPPPDLTPEGFLEVGKIYMLRDNWRVQIKGRTKSMKGLSHLIIRKGFLNDGNMVVWSPETTQPEKHVEIYIKQYSKEEET